MKKGELTWDEIGRLLIALLILVFILLAIWLFKDKLYGLLEGFKLFGG